MINKLAVQLLFSFSVVYCQNCVPLKDCPNLMNLLQNQDSMPNMTRADIYGYVRSLDCGFIGSKPMVNCTEPEVEGIHQITFLKRLVLPTESNNQFRMFKFEFTRSFNQLDIVLLFLFLVLHICYWIFFVKNYLKDLEFVKIQS